VLSNVKTRGGYGEVQLATLLEQLLTVDQFALNVATRPGSNERVEFAIRLPGHGDTPCWLPIDAKFPVEDYERLQLAQDRADIAAIEEAGKALEARVRVEARRIREKYVEPPHTTEFALLFLATEVCTPRYCGVPAWSSRCSANSAWSSPGRPRFRRC